MPTATQENDTDLLILSDSNDTIDNSLSSDKVTVDDDFANNDSELISFDSVNKNVVGSEENTGSEEITGITDILEKSDTGLDLGSSLTTETNNELSESSNLELEDLPTDANLPDISSELSTDDSIIDTNSSTLRVDSIGTMDQIIDKAISDLGFRGNTNLAELDSENLHISDLKEQISDLEAQVTLSEEKIATLNSEYDMITKNIKSLEGMKSTNTTTDLKSETSTKVHNVKRKKAA